MSSVSTITIDVPATSANLGPGFDCLGVALDIHNQFQFSPLPPESDQPLIVEVNGLEADRVNRNQSNLAYQAFLHLYQRLGQTPPPIRLSISLAVPLARGLGSSATAIVGGLLGANALAGSPLSQSAVMDVAIALEGHPDNVVPALLGGCRLAATAEDGSWTICQVPWHQEIVPIVAIPNFELSTAAARKVLPSSYSRADAIFNAAHLGMLMQGLATGEAESLRSSLQDRIHQPYRQALISGYEAVRTAALEAGSYGLVISGAGPTLLALTQADYSVAVKTAIAQVWTDLGIEVQVQALAIDREGATVKEG